MDGMVSATTVLAREHPLSLKAASIHDERLLNLTLSSAVRGGRPSFPVSAPFPRLTRASLITVHRPGDTVASVKLVGRDNRHVSRVYVSAIFQGELA